MKRVVVLAGLAVLAGLCVLATVYERYLAHALGIDTQQSQEYDFVSGVGPMIITAVGYTGVIASIVHHLNCHVDTCPRIGRYPLAGGEFRVCRRHLPDDHPARQKLTAHHIHLAHREHLARSGHA